MKLLAFLSLSTVVSAKHHKCRFGQAAKYIKAYAPVRSAFGARYGRGTPMAVPPYPRARRNFLTHPPLFPAHLTHTQPTVQRNAHECHELRHGMGRAVLHRIKL